MRRNAVISRWSRAVVVTAVFFTVASGAEAHATTLRFGDGGDSVLRRPHYIDTAAAAQMNAVAGRPPQTVVAWTEVRAAGTRRWRWSTYAAWCTYSHCSTPRLVFVDDRKQRRTPEEAVFPWRVGVAADADRRRAFVRAGRSWGGRWALVDATRGVVARGPAGDDADYRGGAPDLAHTPDGRDWVAWSDLGQRIHLFEVRNGARMGGPAVAWPGDSASLSVVGGRFVLGWFSRRDAEAPTFPIKLKTGRSAAGLRAARAQRLGKLGVGIVSVLSVLAAPTGPALAVWQTTENPPDGALIHQAAWITPDGKVGPTVALNTPAFGDDPPWAASADGQLLVCPWALAAPPLGETFISMACPRAPWPVR